MNENKFKLKTFDDERLAMIYMPNYPHGRSGKKSYSQINAMKDFGVGKNIEILIDCDEEGEIISLEILIHDD